MFTFCKPISSKKRFSPHRSLNESFTFTLFENAAMVPGVEWEEVAGKRTIFFDKSYLNLIEGCGNSVIKARYVIVYQKGKPCGIVYFQVIDFNAGLFGDLITGQENKEGSTRIKLLENYIDSNKNEVLLRLFTCGNNLVSGDYGYVFSDKLSSKVAHELLLQIIDVVSKEEKLRGTISAVLLKDFEKPLQPGELFEEQKYIQFQVEPNMVVDIPQTVKSIDEYIALFSKKYRNRAKAILKTGEILEKRELVPDEIYKYEQDIYGLYSAVYEKAKFKLLKLPADYFSKAKSLFPDYFHVCGFFQEDKLLAFSSYFLIEEKFEAHYIGLDYELNHKFELYQNILYYNIASAIRHQKFKVNLGRTAAEIKTTVGAKAENLLCYVKPQNTISKLVMRPLIQFLQPGEWTPRNPFKEELTV